MMNLKEETIKRLEEHGKKPEEIRWVGCSSFKIPISEFWKLADEFYDSSYGSTEVAEDLLIVGDNWWLERHEYDGAEWWEYKTVPSEPEKTIEVPSLFPFSYDPKYCYLRDFYNKRAF